MISQRTLFESLSALGYTALIPIIPPEAKLSEKSKVRESDRGKVPGRLNGYKEWSGFPKWQDYDATEEDLTAWSKWGAGAGLKTGELIAFDIDVLDAEVAGQLVGQVRRMLGHAPMRVGRPPKALLVFRTSATVFKRKISFTLPGHEEHHAVELLGKGQQFVAHGIHPATSRRYKWDTRSGTLPPFNELFELSQEMLDDAWEGLRQYILSLGGQLLEDQRSTATGGRKPIGHDSTTGDPELIKLALESMPNNLGYDDWIRMCAAIKAAFGGDENYYGAFETWCLKYPEATPADARKRWDSVTSSELGANYVLDHARAAGFNDAAEQFEATEDFQVVENPDQRRQQALDDMFERYVWVEEVKRFADVTTGKLLDEKQFNTRLAAVGNPASSRTCASVVYVRSLERRRIAWSLTYRPGAELLVNERHGLSFNTWRASDLKLPDVVCDADVAPWLELVRHVIPDKEARDIILDWSAYAMASPAEKCNWAVLLGSTTHGIGKDLMFQPLVHGLGTTNVKYIGPSDLAGGYTDWAANAKLVIIEEMHSFERKEMMNKLKAFIAAPPEEIRVNMKYVPQYQVPNISAYLFFTNLTNALAIEKEDRRFYVYWSPAKKDDSGLYARVVHFYETGGYAKVSRWLMQRDLLLFDAKGSAPGSVHKDEMRRSAQGALDEWVETSIEEAEAPFNTALVAPEDILHRLPPRIERLKPSRQLLLAAMRSAGAVSLQRVSLGRKLDHIPSGRPVLFAVREHEYHARLSADKLAEAFWEQRDLLEREEESVFNE